MWQSLAGHEVLIKTEAIEFFEEEANHGERSEGHDGKHDGLCLNHGCHHSKEIVFQSRSTLEIEIRILYDREENHPEPVKNRERNGEGGVFFDS